MKPQIAKQILILFLTLASSSLLFAGQGNLTFEQRVAAQRAIEGVYWRHTIWPAENPQPKPALEKILSSSALRKKTEDYLHRNAALEVQTGKAIQPEQLQEEIDRMAKETQDPELLNELWAALDNDPNRIAECLARPILVDEVAQQIDDFEGWYEKNQNRLKAISVNWDYFYQLPKLSRSGAATDTLRSLQSEAANTWTATKTTGAPSGREAFSAIWTGTQMIVFGGYNGTSIVKTGGRYNPATNSWSATSTTNVIPREGHSAVWTGTELIVWGGDNSTGRLQSGQRYNPVTNVWISISTSGAPTARGGQTGVWTGTELIIWGGKSASLLEKSGGRYNPVTNSWTATNLTGAPAGRYSHTAIWTGTQMIVWGGYDGSKRISSGGRYNPSTNKWTATNKTGAPSPRDLQSAVWTGKEMIIWGGENSLSVNTGGRYNPKTNVWIAVTNTGAPSARQNHRAVWTGTQMILWGGFNPGIGNFKTGGKYNPKTNTWVPTNTTGAPSARRFHEAVWTGTQFITWGGFTGTNETKTGGRYTP
jgi:N-acetylneuraminic acid mutarotase